MRYTFVILAAVLGLALTSGAVWSKDFKITKSQVQKACGTGLQGSGNAIGCTKCGGGRCRDYSCNSTGKGRQGCWETVIKRTSSQNDKWRGRAAETAKTNVTPTSTGHGSSGHGSRLVGQRPTRRDH